MKAARPPLKEKPLGKPGSHGDSEGRLLQESSDDLA